MRRVVLAVVVVSLAGCGVRSYSGRCGDPPHGTAYRVLSCEAMHDDAASGGRWRFRCG